MLAFEIDQPRPTGCYRSPAPPPSECRGYWVNIFNTIQNICAGCYRSPAPPHQGCRGYWVNIFNTIQNICGHDASQGVCDSPSGWHGRRGGAAHVRTHPQPRAALPGKGPWDTWSIYFTIQNIRCMIQAKVDSSQGVIQAEV